ncbi:MAG: CPBP family intramembrane glutamic endopeptidase [Candidatus Bathyarchaeia archaeon]
MNIIERTVKSLNYFIVALASINLTLYLFSLFLGVYMLISIQEAAEYMKEAFTPFIIIYMIPLRIPAQLTVGEVFTLLNIIYAIFFALTYMTGDGFHRQFKHVKDRNVLIPSNNWLLSMPYISGALLIGIIILQSFQEAHGVPTGGIRFNNPFNAMFSLAYSPLIEEIGFRVTPIGTLISIITYRATKERRLKKIWNASVSYIHPDRVKDALGLPTVDKNGVIRGLTVYEWILIAGSSAMFGLAHYFSGSGWNVGKISSATLAGVVLSIVYIWKGIPACVLLHWFFNYFGYVFDVAGAHWPNLLSPVSSLLDGVILLSGILGMSVIGFKTFSSLIKLLKPPTFPFNRILREHA